MAANPLQGEVWMMDVSPTVENEIHGYRPALIITNNAFNTSHPDMVIVCPITSNIRGWPFQVEVPHPEGGLDQDSVVLVDQLRTVAHARLERRLGQVRSQTLDAVLTMLNRLTARSRIQH